MPRSSAPTWLRPRSTRTGRRSWSWARTSVPRRRFRRRREAPGSPPTTEAVTMERKQLDVRGLKCPVPIVRAKKEIDVMKAGDLLEVLATDPGSVSDFQGWVKTSKLAALREQRAETDAAGKGIYVHVFERLPA